MVYQVKEVVVVLIGGFKGRKFGVSRPTKFQLVGGKGKKVAGKGTKSSK